MKLYKRNKVLLISICAISIVSLVTIGFSSWILGIDDSKKDLDKIKVDIDTVSDKTSILEIKTKEDNPSLFLSENVSKSTDISDTIGFGYTFNEKSPAKFDIELDYFNFAFYKENTTFNGITFSFSVTKENVTNPNTPSINKFNRSNDETYNYIEFATSNITKDNLDSMTTLTTVGNYNYYSLNDKILSFKWGNYYSDTYNNKTSNSPASYYQLQLDKVSDTNNDGSILSEQLDVLSKAKEEFDALDNSLKGATIKLTVTLNVTFNS